MIAENHKKDRTVSLYNSNQLHVLCIIERTFEKVKLLHGTQNNWNLTSLNVGTRYPSSFTKVNFNKFPLSYD